MSIQKRNNTLYIAMVFILFLVSCSGVNTGTSNNYVTFEIVDQQQSGLYEANELFWQIFSANGFSYYDGIYNLTQPQAYVESGVSLMLANSNSLNMVMNNVRNIGFLSLESVAAPLANFYGGDYHGISIISWTNTNSYRFNFTYNGLNYSAVINNLPIVYSISSATCSQISTGYNCNVATYSNNFLNEGESLTYIFNPGSNQCLGTRSLSKSTFMNDYVNFPNCVNFSLTPKIQLILAFKVPLTFVQNQLESGAFNMQGLYYFQSDTSAPVTTQ